MVAIVVVGAAGWLGSAITARLPQALAIRRPADLEAGLAAAGAEPVIVNAAGQARGSAEELWAANVDLVSRLLDAAGWMVQLGSAAEYGLGVTSPVPENAPCAPTSDYGRSKLEGTIRARDSGRATVLRLFNTIDAPPQPGSPIADIWSRIRRGVQSETPIEVLSGGTRRDYVTRAMVAESVLFAAQHRCPGVFNVGSGVPARVEDIARLAARRLGSQVPVRDLREFPATTIYSDPQLWATVSGLQEHLDAQAVASLLTADPDL